MLASRTRFIAAIFVAGLSLASCGRGGGSSPMTPLAQSLQPAQQTKVTAAHGKRSRSPTLRLDCLTHSSHQNVALSGCGVRGASREIASLPQAGNLQVFDVPGAIKVGKCPQYLLFSGLWDSGLFNKRSRAPSWEPILFSKEVFIGFIRTADGNYTSFQPPGAGFEPLNGTSPDGNIAINNPPARSRGTTAIPQYVLHGFVRHKDGSFFAYDAPWASQIPNDSIQQGTVTFNINAGGDTA